MVYSTFTEKIITKFSALFKIKKKKFPENWKQKGTTFIDKEHLKLYN